LAAGEIAKIGTRRKIDLPVCTSLLAALIPLVLFAPVILKAKAYSAHFWGVPYWGAMVSWYPTMAGRLPLVFLAAACLFFVLRLPANEEPRRIKSPVDASITVVLACSALLPVVGVTAAQLITHAWAGRYLLATVPSMCILSLWGLRRVIRNDTAGPAI